MNKTIEETREKLVNSGSSIVCLFDEATCLTEENPSVAINDDGLAVIYWKQKNGSYIDIMPADGERYCYSIGNEDGVVRGDHTTYDGLNSEIRKAIESL